MGQVSSPRTIVQDMCRTLYYQMSSELRSSASSMATMMALFLGGPRPFFVVVVVVRFSIYPDLGQNLFLLMHGNCRYEHLKKLDSSSNNGVFTFLTIFGNVGPYMDRTIHIFWYVDLNMDRMVHIFWYVEPYMDCTVHIFLHIDVVEGRVGRGGNGAEGWRRRCPNNYPRRPDP